VRQFVQIDDGTIQLESSPGNGTTVTVTLPLSKAE
jgi:signal transduction histidine kinase